MSGIFQVQGIFWISSSFSSSQILLKNHLYLIRRIIFFAQISQLQVGSRLPAHRPAPDLRARQVRVRPARGLLRTAIVHRRTRQSQVLACQITRTARTAEVWSGRLSREETVMSNVVVEKVFRIHLKKQYSVKFINPQILASVPKR